DQALPVANIRLQRLLEIEAQQCVIRILRAWIVRCDHRSRVGKEVIKALEEQTVNDREMTGVLVRRPLAGLGATLQEGRWHLADKRNNNHGCPFKGVDDGWNGL